MVVLYYIVACLVFLFTLRVFSKWTNEICKSKKRLDGKTTIVTGGTSGMGFEIATEFAKRGARVIIACPFEEEGVNARKLIVQKSGSDKVIFKRLDLGSLQSVRQFAAEILKNETRLDILMNNAGVGLPDDFMTKDGLSFIMHVNYFGHFLLTLLLLPLLIKTGTPNEPARIVNISSLAHWLGIVDIDQPKKMQRWVFHTYSKSKLCLMWFSIELTKRLKGHNVVINNVDPGFVGTRIFESLGKKIGPVLSYFCGLLFKTSWEGAQTGLHVALDATAGEVSGTHFWNCKPARGLWMYKDARVERLWKQTVEAVGMSEEEIKQCLDPK